MSLNKTFIPSWIFWIVFCSFSTNRVILIIIVARSKSWIYIKLTVPVQPVFPQCSLFIVLIWTADSKHKRASNQVRTSVLCQQNHSLLRFSSNKIACICILKSVKLKSIFCYFYRANLYFLVYQLYDFGKVSYPP